MHIRPTSGPVREPDGVEVVLVETDDWAEIAGAMGPRGSGATADGTDVEPVDDDDADRTVRTPRHPRRWYVWRSAVAVATVLVLVVVLNVVQERRHDARIAALGQIAGFLRPIPGPPTEQWRVPGTLIGEASGLMLLADPAGEAVTAVDPATGTVRWTLVGEGQGATLVYCQVVGASSASTTAPAEPPPSSRLEDRDVLACITDVQADDGSAQPTSIALVDARTGEHLGSYEVDDSVVMLEQVGTDLLVGSVRGEGRLDVARIDPRTGDARWSYTSPAAMFGRDPLMLQSVDLRADALVVTALAGTLAISLTTGEAVDAEEAAFEPATHEVLSLPGGRTAVWRWNPTGTSGRGQVDDADGRRAYALTGPVQRPPVRDGSVSRTLVVGSTIGTRLRGVNLRSGRQLWSTEVGPMSSTYPVAQVAGVMLLAGQDALKALDLRDGSLLWTAGSDSTVRGSGLTDGDRAIVARSEEAGPVLTAVALGDGAEVWRADLPPGTLRIMTAGGRLLAETGDAVVALG